MITSSKLDWFSKRHHLTHCVACTTFPLKDKYLKTASRMVTLCQHECGNAIKSQLRTEWSSCMSFSGSFLILCTRLVSFRPGLNFYRLYWAGKLTFEFLPPTQKSSLEHEGYGLPTSGWTGMKRTITGLFYISYLLYKSETTEEYIQIYRYDGILVGKSAEILQLRFDFWEDYTENSVTGENSSVTRCNDFTL